VGKPNAGVTPACRHQDSNLGRTHHTALNRARLAARTWRHRRRVPESNRESVVRADVQVSGVATPQTRQERLPPQAVGRLSIQPSPTTHAMTASVTAARLIAGAYFGDLPGIPHRTMQVADPSGPDTAEPISMIDPTKCACLDEYPHVK